jgi:hypothetical protein
MFGGLYRLVGAVADWRPRDFLIGMVAAEAVALLAVVSLGFGIFAAFTHLAATQGTVHAALVISGSAAVVAAIAGFALARWQAGEPPPDSLEVLLKSLTAAGTQQDQAALISALRLGRDLTPMELLAVSLVSGFFAGRKAGK